MMPRFPRPIPRRTLALSLALAAVALVPLVPPPTAAAAQGVAGADPGRLYARVETTDGAVYEGYIRWGGNEAGWFDVLHANKPVPDRNRRDAERLGWEPDRRENRIRLFGLEFSWPDGSSLGIGGSAQSGIRFGHVSSLEVTGANRARLLLRTGDEVTFNGGGDVGSSVDEILVEDRSVGPVELEWREVRVLDFMRPPAEASVWGTRLYGTLQTRDGREWTGYVVWDMDELFTVDILDGDEDGRDVEIPFGSIRGIERFGSGASRVYLADGSVRVLRGSNDVNSGNRDILVADPALGEIRVAWDAFDRLALARPPAEVDFSVFDRGGRLRGTVHARGGETQTGWIRWDNDEEYGWEILDGELAEDVTLDVELGAIRSIERVAYDASRVTLRDGRAFELTDSNDVGEGNRGVYVERDDGTLVLVPWDRFVRVVFDG